MNFSFPEFWNQVREFFNLPLIELGGAVLTLGGILKFFGLVALVFVVELVLRRYVILRLLRHTKLQAALQYAIGKIGGYLFIALGFYLALKTVGIDLTSLAVFAGAIGVGLGFGLQNIISNFISGLIILAERPIAIGDRVEVDGVAGQVTRIRLRSTTVVTNDNISIIVPNTNFITQKVVNWSHGGARVQLRLPLTVAYGTDPEKLQRVLLAVAAAHPKVLNHPHSAVFFDSFGENGMHFELGVWTTEMVASPRRFRSEINYAIEKALRANAIQIPIPQREVHLRSGAMVPPPTAAEVGPPGDPPPIG